VFDVPEIITIETQTHANEFSHIIYCYRGGAVTFEIEVILKAIMDPAVSKRNMHLNFRKASINFYTISASKLNLRLQMFQRSRTSSYYCSYNCIVATTNLLIATVY